MKKLPILLIALILFPFILASISFFILPESIPAHFNSEGLVDRMGNRGEVFILPVTGFLFGGLFLLGTKRFALKKENGLANYRSLLLSGAGMMLLFNGMTLYYCAIALSKTNNLNAFPIDMTQLMIAISAIILIAVGNYLPKVRKNPWIGVRTRWSLQNDSVWKKSQRFGGICFISAGFLLLFACFLLKGWLLLALFFAILLLIAILVSSYSYKIYQKQKQIIS